MLACLLGRFGNHRHLQTPADCLGDLSDRHALFGDRVIPGSRGTFLKNEPVETGGIEQVHRGPAIESFADIRRNALLASDRDRVGDEPMLESVVNLRKTHHQNTHATRRDRGGCLFRNSGERGIDGGRSSSVARRPGATSPVPEVTIKGRSEPVSAEPSASIARRSVSQFTANFEKSWLKAV